MVNKTDTYFHYFFVPFFTLFILLCGPVDASQKQELVILTWSDYMDPELVRQFESRNRIKVRFVYFESDELRDDMLVNTDGRGYDIICSNGRAIKTYTQRGWLEPVDNIKVPNRQHIEPRWLTAFPQASEFAVPYFWGTAGIAYRKDLVKKPITRWKQLLQPAQELQGKIVLIKDARDLMMTALKSQGVSINTTDAKSLEQARQLLMTQKPHVKDYSYIAITRDSALVKGTAIAALAYNGDALALGEYNENIGYIIPEEGTTLWVDYFVVSKASKQKKLAMDFLDFINEPGNAAQMAEYVYFASPNMAARKHLPQDFLNDPLIYPDQSVLKRGEFYHELPPRTQRIYNRILPQVVGE